MSSMKPKIARMGVLTALSLALAACDNESRERPPQTQVDVVHAAPSFGELAFLRVERREATLGYGDSDVSSWDTDTYTFNVDAVRPLADPERVLSFTETLSPGNNYTIVLAQDGGDLREIVIETEGESLGATETEVTIVHTASTLGPVDVYLEPPGTDLAAATPRGTLSFLENLPPFNVEEADYQISLTDVGLPANVLLTSRGFGIVARIKTVITLLDGANVGLAPYAALVSGSGESVPLADQSIQSGIRAINAMTNDGALDVTIDNNFTPPLLPAVPAGVPSAYSFFDAGDRSLTVSPAGNPGVLEVDEEFTAESGVLGTWFIAGDPGALAATFTVDDGRTIAGEARLDIYNGSANNVDVYVVETGTDINTVAATVAVGTLLSVADIALALDDLEITVRQAATTNVLAGPLPVTVTAEGNYGILLTDNAGGTVDMTLLDDFN